MFAMLLAALFVAAAIGSAVMLVDSAVRGRNAFRQLRGQLARLETAPRIRVTFAEPVREAGLPALRSRALSAPRPARRPVRSPARSLPAAA